MEHQEYNIARSFCQPLRFNGCLISEGSDKRYDSNRWTNVRIYKTKGGRYIIEIENITCWEGERNTTVTDMFDTAELLVCYVRSLGCRNGTFEAISKAAKEDAEINKAWVEVVQ